MSNKSGQHYLHTNGKIIHKPFGGVSEDVSAGGFVVRVWENRVIGESPGSYFDFLREAYAAGALVSEIKRLAEHNNLDKFIPRWYEKLKAVV